MPHDLKTLRHQGKRHLWVWLVLLCGLIVVRILMVNDVIGGWGWLILALVGALIVAIAVWQSRARVRDLRTENGGFVAPIYTGWPIAVAYPGIFLLSLRFGTLRPPLHAGAVIASTAELLLGFVWLVIVWWGFRRWKRQVLVIGVAGLEIMPGGRPKTILWDEIAGATRSGRAIQIAIQSPRARFGWSETVVVILVDLDWLAAVIEHYRTDPAARAAIGEPAELDRIRRIEVPAAPRSAQPAL